MSAAAPKPVQPFPFPRRPRSAGGRLYVTVVVAIVVATLGAFVWSIAAGRNTVRGIPPEQRAALLSRTVDDLRASCGAGRAAALEDHCRELASFAAQFDECQGECRALVRPLITPNPTR